MKKEILVLGVKKYDFVTEDGEKVQGTKVYFYDEEGEESDSDKVKGYIPATRWFSGFEKYDQFQSNKLPGKYEMEYDIRISEKGIKLVVKEFTYKENAETIA